jgi:hypothetical protein
VFTILLTKKKCFVLQGMFEKFSELLSSRFMGYKILRAEAEPGISWDDFRSDRRGLLVWLIKTSPHPLASLLTTSAMKQKDATGENDEDAKITVLADVVTKQMNSLKLQMIKMIEQKQAHFDEIWKIAGVTHQPSSQSLLEDMLAKSHLDPATVKSSPSRSRRKSQTDEWSVVDDDETSSSLSGFDDYYSSD